MGFRRRRVTFPACPCGDATWDDSEGRWRVRVGVRAASRGRVPKSRLGLAFYRAMCQTKHRCAKSKGICARRHWPSSDMTPICDSPVHDFPIPDLFFSFSVSFSFFLSSHICFARHRLDFDAALNFALTVQFGCFIHSRLLFPCAAAKFRM